MPRNALRVSVILVLSVLGWAGKEFPQQPGEQVLPNQLVVKLKAGANPSLVIPAFLAAAQITSLNLPDHYVVRTSGFIPPGIITRLAAHNLVDFVEPDRIRQLVVTAPNDPSYQNSLSGQWGLFTTQAFETWNVLGGSYLTAATAGGDRINVAVLDTGADCTHPDFINTGGSSTNSAFGGQLSWSASQAMVATTVASPTCAWQDDHGHGTHVTGIVAAATSNATGVAALGYPLQVMEYKVLNASGSGSDSTIANAITAAVNAGAKVISMSLGGAGYSQTLQSAINYAWQRDVVVVAAAGNSATNSVFYPGAANYAVAIAATDINNNVASFSNFGNYVALAAPGVTIRSTLPTYPVSLGCCNYGSLSGTSMATPFASALAGLIAMSTPNTSAAAIVQRMEQTAASSATNGVWCCSASQGGSIGYGIINAYKAITGSPRLTSTGGVVGQIVDASSNPVNGAQITAGVQMVSTDASGLYWIRSLTAGTYPLVVSATGYPTQSLGVTVAAGADTPFTVKVGVSYGSFTGTVTDQGAPVAAAIVQALSGGLIVGTAVSDASGQYTLW